MLTVGDVHEFLVKIAPVELKMDFDNVGLLVGKMSADTCKILVSLDITSAVISEATDIGAKLIVSHHPLFFSLKSVTDTDITGSKIIKLLECGISAICMHTNLDAAQGGVNDALASAAGLIDAKPLPGDGDISYGRVGNIKTPCDMQKYLTMLKKTLKTNGLRYHNAGKKVSKVAVVGGSGGDMLQSAHAVGCDTFVTADIKYDVFLQAKELGVNLIDGDHFCTENLVTAVLAQRLSNAFDGVQVLVSKRHGQTAEFF